MSRSRREALSALAAGLSTALAGCGATGDRDREPGGPASTPVEDYAVDRVRNADGARLVTAGEAPTRTADDSGPPPAGHTTEFLVSRAAVEELRFGTVPAADRLASFVRETDFSQASVFLMATPVAECYEVRVESVALSPDGDPDLHFCRARLPADVACETSAHDSVGIAVRLPVAREASTGYSSGMSSSCRGPSGEAFEVTVTATEGS